MQSYRGLSPEGVRDVFGLYNIGYAKGWLNHLLRNTNDKIMPDYIEISNQGYIQQVSIECVIIGYQDRQLKVLIPKLDFKGDFWALPAGYVHQNEDIEQAAQRVLHDRTGIDDVFLKQFQVMGKAARNSRAFLDRMLELNPEKLDAKQQRGNDYDWFIQRTISIGYYALVDINRVVAQKHVIDQSIGWYPMDQLPDLIMDHNQILRDAIETFIASLELNLNVLNLLPETFTMLEVQELYEAILGKAFARNNFPKKILDFNLLDRLEKKFTGVANKAPFLYRLRRQNAQPGYASDLLITK